MIGHQPIFLNGLFHAVDLIGCSGFLINYVMVGKTLLGQVLVYRSSTNSYYKTWADDRAIELS